MRTSSVGQKKTLAYIGERIKQQKKYSYYHSDKYKEQQRKIIEKLNEQKVRENNYKVQLQEQKEEIERNKPLSKLKNVVKNIMEGVDDISRLFVRIIADEFKSFCKDIKKELNIK